MGTSRISFYILLTLFFYHWKYNLSCITKYHFGYNPLWQVLSLSHILILTSLKVNAMFSRVGKPTLKVLIISYLLHSQIIILWPYISYIVIAEIFLVPRRKYHRNCVARQQKRRLSASKSLDLNVPVVRWHKLLLNFDLKKDARCAHKLCTTYTHNGGTYQ